MSSRSSSKFDRQPCPTVPSSDSSISDGQPYPTMPGSNSYSIRIRDARYILNQNSVLRHYYTKQPERYSTRTVFYGTTIQNSRVVSCDSGPKRGGCCRGRASELHKVSESGSRSDSSQTGQNTLSGALRGEHRDSHSRVPVCSKKFCVASCQ